jgi:serine/threonine protein phosphatase PrpC
MQSLMQKHADPETLAPALVEAAFQHGSKDNITALVVRYEP